MLAAIVFAVLALGLGISGGSSPGPLAGRLGTPARRGPAIAARLPAATGASGAGVLPAEGLLGPPGIYEFAATDRTADADDPLLAGTTVTVDWSNVEPQAGQLDWSVIDTAIAPWAAAGKRVILRVSPGSDVAWGNGAGDATPGWVYGEGVGQVDDDGSILPAYWDPAFVAAYSAFVAAYAARYDGDPSVAFVEMGIGEGGETLADTQLDRNRLALLSAAGYDDQIWLTYVKAVSRIYRDDFRKTAVVALVDSSFLGQRRHEDYGALTRWLERNGFPMQYDGLVPGSRLPGGAWKGVSTISEQRDPAQGSAAAAALLAECRAAVSRLHSRWLLVYQSDVDSSADHSALAACQQLIVAQPADPG